MRACLSFVRGFSLFLVLFAVPGIGWGQGQLGTVEGLKKAFSDTNKRRDQLHSGEATPVKGDANVAEAIANYYLYRITHVTERPEKVQEEFSKAVDSAMEKRAKSNRAYVEGYFAPALAKSMTEVLNRDFKADRSAVIHAAMMLPALGRLKADATNDLLIALVKNGNDVVRLYALKGLRETMPITPQPLEVVLDFKDAAQNQKRNRDTLHVDSLARYIQTPIPVSGMRDEEVAAVRYIRREAIISLARAGSPAVLARPIKLGKKADPDGPVAPALLMVLAGNVKPGPSLQEKVEAVVGLCNLKYPEMPEYDPSVATFLIGQTMLEFTAEYSKDLANFGVGGAKKELPYLAWKTEAKRLKASLGEYTKTTKTKQATELQAYSEPILEAVGDYKTPNAAKVNELRQKVQFSRPASGAVFRTLKTPEVLPAPAN